MTRLKIQFILIGLACGRVALADNAPTTKPTTKPTTRDLSEFILTPPIAHTPRINGPSRFGVRPGNPLLYTIPATGDRPMSFEAMGLPQGATIDAKTGRLGGAINKAGDYKIKLRAQNDKGMTERDFTIVVGENISLTPAMGWNSYNCWADAVDQDKVSRAAHAMAASGLIDHGWTYVNIDDAWQGQRSGEFNALQPDSRKFTDIKALCDDVHSLGLKVGIYSTPWVKAYSGKLGGSAENAEGIEQFDWSRTAPKNKKVLPFAIGKYSLATNDAKQFAAWGMDYLKYDWGPCEPPEAKEMNDALRASGRDVVFSISNNHVGNIIKVIDNLAPLVNSWRTTTDITDNWKRVSADIGFNQEKWSPYIGPGHCADADMLVVGVVGWGKNMHQSRLTPDEQYTHVTLWCLLSSPLLLGCDLEKLDPFTLNLLTNDEILAVDQDALVKPPARISPIDNIEIYVKELEDGSRAVGVFNRGEDSSQVTVRWTDIGLKANEQVRDLWRQKDLGTMAEKIDLTVAPHGAILLKTKEQS